jgi:phenylpyruvate tautomerase PptA (4-oxalocrotonate tautomerase family)
MPMLDAFIPEGALTPSAEDALLSKLTDLLLRHEGADPSNEQARSIAWVFVHRPTVYVAGSPAAEPRYRLIASVPEGQWDDERRPAVVAEMTEAVLDAEDGARSRDPDRVWVFCNEVPDGTWGGRGEIFRLGDIAGFVLGDADAGRKYAEARLGERRRELATSLLDAAGERTPA